MAATELTLFCLVSFLFLCVGGVIGWLAKGQSFETEQRNSGWLHPEFFDEQGNVIPDEVISVRFQEGFFDGDDEDDEDDD
jgi:hypothetical protein